MPVHEINGVGHAEILQRLAERIDDLSGQQFVGADDEIEVRRRSRLASGAGTDQIERKRPHRSQATPRFLVH